MSHPNAIKCFLCEPTARAESSLRRYALNNQCPGPWKYHNASIVIGEVDYEQSEFNGQSTPNFDHTDPRWPKQCECGYQFLDNDEWQHSLERIYYEVGGQGRRFPLRKAPPGAMWYSTWEHYLKGPDGKALFVQTPAGEWGIDQYSSKRERPWTRTGIPPLVSASPSILIGDRYHGWLTNGELIPC